ncbi:hypothetical protein P7K49_003334 [Saguinus oedipus]|uniref:Uncharacterized protein n=1 Tax=Saguinus oedipus TaxID=9490 RepID=A0ABQ9WJW9_SAGOE|nr:hypothetical protein P7K49_003334 [Saguinus oedipus]
MGAVGAVQALGPVHTPHPLTQPAHPSFVTVPRVATMAGAVVTAMIGPRGAAGVAVVGPALLNAVVVATVASGGAATAGAAVTSFGMGQAGSNGLLSAYSALRGRHGFRLRASPPSVPPHLVPKDQQDKKIQVAPSPTCGPRHSCPVWWPRLDPGRQLCHPKFQVLGQAARLSVTSNLPGSAQILPVVKRPRGSCALISASALP